MTPQDELDLIRRAILLGRTVTGCCEWHDRSYRRVRNDAELQGLTPEAVRQLLLDHVAGSGTIQKVKEQRPEHGEYEFYHKAIISVPDFLHGLFVEMCLTDDDADYPVVLLVNAHPQRK
jgi:hypothetical protein